jgi:hypothetical protein
MEHSPSWETDGRSASQELVTYPYPKPKEWSPLPKPYFSKIHFNIILTFTPLPSE